MRSKHGDDQADSVLHTSLDSDPPEERDLLDRLSAKLLRLEREALELAAAMRQKPKAS